MAALVDGAVISNFVFALTIFGGELPAGARLSARFEPSSVKSGDRTTLELSVTPPPGSVLLAFAQPKGLGAPTAVDLEAGLVKLAGPLDEPAVKERSEPALQSQTVRFYPHSFGGTVVVKLPMLAPSRWIDGRAELRGTVTLMFVDEKSGKLTLAAAVPISATLEETDPPPPTVGEPPPVVLEAPPKQKDDPPSPPVVDPGAIVEIVAPPELDPPPAPTQRWFLVGVAAGVIALAAGPIGVYDERRLWARWLGWRRLQGWTTAVFAATLLAGALTLPTRTSIPALVGAAAFGAMLFATGGGPWVKSPNFLAAALRAQPLHALVLSFALLAKASCWDATAGFALIFVARSFAPAIAPGDDDFAHEEEDDEEPPRRRRSKSGRRRAA
jgi:hypothetical protein